MTNKYRIGDFHNRFGAVFAEGYIRGIEYRWFQNPLGAITIFPISELAQNLPHRLRIKD